MNRTLFNKSVVPGLFSFMTDSYRPRSQDQIWRKLAKVKNSRRAYEEAAYYGTLGTFPIKPEGKAISYDKFVQGPTKRWTHVTYALGVKMTEELIDDALYPDIPTQMEDMSRELGNSARETLEILTHDIINSGTGTGSHTDGENAAIFRTDHTRLRGGTWSNLLSPAADLSATSLQTALQEMENLKDDSGKIQVIKPEMVWVAPANEWKLLELLDSAYDPESANNAINAIRTRRLRPMVSPYLTDTDAFTLQAPPPNQNSGVIAYMRRNVTFAQDGDFETGDAKFKGTFRFSVEVNKPVNLYHSAGA